MFLVVLSMVRQHTWQTHPLAPPLKKKKKRSFILSLAIQHRSPSHGTIPKFMIA